MKRLVLVKQLFSHGKSHRLHETEMGNMLACHHYDLAIEMLLRIIGTELNAKITPEIRFGDLWNEVNQVFKEKYNNDIPLKQEIRPLRNARNSAQHSGTIPSTPDLERFESYTETFLDNVIQTVFNLSFAEIKMSSLIKDGTLKAYINEAENMIIEGNHINALEKLSIAFAIGSGKATEQIYEVSWLRILRPFALDDLKKIVGHRPISELEEAFEKIEEMLTFIGLGMDYREYMKFKQRSFTTHWIIGRDEPRIYMPPNKTFDLNDAKFCYDFVLNSFIDWQL